VIPRAYRVTHRKEETPDTVTLALAPQEQPLPAALPGQFHMLYAFGVGEVPISVSGENSFPTFSLCLILLRLVRL
jgi:NAD(P)H-flavin reductase